MQSEIDDLDNYYTIKEMSDLTGLSTKTMYRYIEKEIITKVIKMPNLYLIHKDEFKKIYKKLYAN